MPHDMSPGEALLNAINYESEGIGEVIKLINGRAPLSFTQTTKSDKDLLAKEHLAQLKND